MQNKIHATLTVKLPVPELRGGNPRTHNLNLGPTAYCSYIYFSKGSYVRFVNTQTGQFTHKIHAILCQKR